MTDNSDFGIPPVTEPAKALSPQERIAALRAKAEAEAAAEFNEEAVYAKLLAEARQKKIDELSAAEAGIPLDTSGFPEDYDKVTVFKGQGKFDLSYVPLGINGYVIKVPRGVPVILPHAFVAECLEHAVETQVEQASGGLVLRDTHRFPYQFHGKATTEEYKKFQAQQRELAGRQAVAA